MFSFLHKTQSRYIDKILEPIWCRVKALSLCCPPPSSLQHHKSTTSPSSSLSVTASAVLVDQVVCVRAVDVEQHLIGIDQPVVFTQLQMTTGLLGSHHDKSKIISTHCNGNLPVAFDGTCVSFTLRLSLGTSALRVIPHLFSVRVKLLHAPPCDPLDVRCNSLGDVSDQTIEGIMLTLYSLGVNYYDNVLVKVISFDLESVSRLLRWKLDKVLERLSSESVVHVVEVAKLLCALFRLRNTSLGPRLSVVGVTAVCGHEEGDEQPKPLDWPHEQQSKSAELVTLIQSRWRGYARRAHDWRQKMKKAARHDACVQVRHSMSAV